MPVKQTQPFPRSLTCPVIFLRPVSGAARVVVQHENDGAAGSVTDWPTHQSVNGSVVVKPLLEAIHRYTTGPSGCHRWSYSLSTLCSAIDSNR